MNAWSLVPIIVGVCIVMQGVLNRIFSEPFGLGLAIFVNAIVFAILSFGAFWMALKFPGSVPDFAIPRLDNYEFRLWHLIPGACGFLIVALTPWAIQQMGAAPVFILIVTTQILLSSQWDQWIEGQALSPQNWAGLALVAVGAFLFHWRH